MLHMILGILKVIGLILGILLLLLLAALLALIFVPVRYKLTAKVLPEQYAFSLRGSWLLHIVSASLSVDSERGRRIALRLFGIRLPLFRSEGERKERATPEDSEDPEDEEDSEDVEDPEDIEDPEDEEDREKPEKYDDEEDREDAEEIDNSGEHKDAEDSENVKVSQNPADAEDSENAKVPQDRDEEEDPGNAEEPERRNILQKIWFHCRNICDKIRRIIRKFTEAVKGFWRTLAKLKRRAAQLRQKAIALLRKPGELRKFIEEYELRKVFGGLIGHLLFLIAHYKPRRIRGYLRFGVDDPSVTGQLTGLIYLLLPARAERYSVEPQFNETVFETETICSGHIRALHVLRVLWRAFRDKKLRRMINKLRKRGDS